MHVYIKFIPDIKNSKLNLIDRTFQKVVREKLLMVFLYLIRDFAML